MAEATPENRADVTQENRANVSETEGETLPAARKVKLQTIDGTEFEVEEAIAKKFLTLKSFVEEKGYFDSTIPLPNVRSTELYKIIEFYQKTIEFNAETKSLDGVNSCGNRTGDIETFKEAFVRDMTNEDIKKLLSTANYLNAGEIMNFLCQCVADRIENKSVEYVREFFGIESDFTEEEEAALRQENAWAFEGVDED